MYIGFGVLLQFRYIITLDMLSNAVQITFQNFLISLSRKFSSKSVKEFLSLTAGNKQKLEESLVYNIKLTYYNNWFKN